MELMPSVEQANSMSEDLDKKMKFELMVVSPEAKGELKGRSEVKTERLHCLMSGNIHKAEGDQIYLTFVTVLWSPWKSTDCKRMMFGVKVFYREKAIDYPQLQFYGLWRSLSFHLYHNFS